MSVSSAEENKVRECVESAVALVSRAEEIISEGSLPEIDKTRLTGGISNIRWSLVGINSQGLNVYREFRKVA